MTSAVVRK